MQYRWDEYELDLPARRLRRADGDVHVEPQVFDVLALLVENRHRVVTKEEILDAVWGDQFVSESALTTRVKEVRRALGDDGRTQRYVRNVHGRGYQFVGEPHEVRAGSVRQPPAADSVSTPTQIHLAASIAVDDEFPFVGRSIELETIEQLIHSNGHSTQVFIGGAPGMGKSRLGVQTLERATERGAIVCAGRCDEQLTSGLQAVRDAIAQLATSRPEDFVQWCEGIESPLLTLIPSVSALLHGESSPVDGYAGIDVLLTVLDRAAAGNQLFILVDDLQWSDEPTRALLAQLHRRFGHRRITTIATFRSAATDLRAGAGEWISTQSRQPRAIRIDLEELDDTAASELVRAARDSSDPNDEDSFDTQRLLAQTAGHALFLTEMLRDSSRGVASSDSVSALVAARLERLDEPVQQLVRAGAVLGSPFSFDIASRAVDLAPSDALAAIDIAVQAELLHETNSLSRFRFSHQLVPEAIRAALSRAALAQIHHRCAMVLEDMGADDVEVALHLLGSIPLVQLEEALEQAMAAAGAAIDENQFDRAIRLLERCLEVQPQTRQRAETLILIGEARVRSGRSLSGVPFFDEAAELARQNDWVDVLVAAALGRLGLSPFRKPAERETKALIREAIAALGDKSSIERAFLVAKLGAFSMFDERLDYRTRQIDEAFAMAGDVGKAERMRLLEWKSIVYTCPAGARELEAIDAELDQLRAETNTYFADAAAPETARLMFGDGQGFRDAARVDEMRVQAQPIAEWRDLALRSTLAAFNGDFVVARRCSDDAAGIGEPYWGDSAPVLHAFGQLFIDSLANDWKNSLALFDMIVSVTNSMMFLPAAGWTHAMNGDMDYARDIAAKLCARKESFTWFGEYILGGNILVPAAELALAVDDDELCTVAEEALAPFSHLVLGVPWACSFAAADPVARLARRRGDDAAADAYEQQARDLYGSLDAPALLARLA